jgi:hypothetical protein
MTPIDEKLQRLLAAAAKTTPEADRVPPLGLETRVLAEWRAARSGDDSISVFVFFRRAMVGASLILVLCAAWSLSQPAGSVTSQDAAQLDYNIQMSLNP